MKRKPREASGKGMTSWPGLLTPGRALSSVLAAGSWEAASEPLESPTC